MSEKIRAPYIIRTVSPEQIERGKKLQASMEQIDAESRRKLAEENRVAEAARVEQERLAGIEETRRAASVSGKLMDSRYGWVGSTTRKDESR